MVLIIYSSFVINYFYVGPPLSICLFFFFYSYVLSPYFRSILDVQHHSPVCVLLSGLFER